MKIKMEATYSRALMLVNRPSEMYEYIYRKVPSMNIARLTGKNTPIGEYRVQMRIMIIKNLMPS